jgi:hypothetical protein
VVSTLTKHGSFRLHAHKGGIGFINRMTFAGLSLRKRWVDLFFLLPAPLDHRRIRRLDLYGPTSWGHTVRLVTLEDVDSELEDWLVASMRRGNQETLDPRASVRPLSSTQMAVFRTAFRGRVGGVEGAPAVALPRHVADALGTSPAAVARVAGVSYPVRQMAHGLTIEMPLDLATGLSPGQQVDVHITGSKTPPLPMLGEEALVGGGDPVP